MEKTRGSSSYAVRSREEIIRGYVSVADWPECFIEPLFSHLVNAGFIPKGARNIEVAKDFMRYFMQPEVMNENLKGGLGRWVPVVSTIVTDDPWWLDPKDPHRATYVHEAPLGPTIPSYNGFNPAWGQVNAEQVWGQAHADVIKNGMTPQAAVDKAFRRAESIFSKFQFV